MKQKSLFYALICCLLTASAVSAQTQKNAPNNISNSDALSKTANGRRVLDFFSAFNSGDKEKFKIFFLENLPAEEPRLRCAEQPPAEHFADYMQKLKEDFGSFEIKKIIVMSEKEIKTLVQGAKGGWAQLFFEFDPNPPNKMFGLEVMKRNTTSSADDIENSK